MPHPKLGSDYYNIKATRLPIWRVGRAELAESLGNFYVRGIAIDPFSLPFAPFIHPLLEIRMLQKLIRTPTQVCLQPLGQRRAFVGSFIAGIEVGHIGCLLASWLRNSCSVWLSNLHSPSEPR
jgi:hypothetical protein